jgi:hypothetical protein
MPGSKQDAYGHCKEYMHATEVSSAENYKNSAIENKPD